ncbi:hypothetical protein GWK47_034539 [Chionoecetes opilio]|uniref:Secreted protein n=1 Tax=Chionoecetes opilio TaxID=41210 RepID=A0A8J4YI71_CHIOP|nr:hypothetical protein GWK47_034539 [Chionoecetes opilio]
MCLLLTFAAASWVHFQRGFLCMNISPPHCSHFAGTFTSSLQPLLPRLRAPERNPDLFCIQWSNAASAVVSGLGLVTGGPDSSLVHCYAWVCCSRAC